MNKKLSILLTLALGGVSLVAGAADTYYHRTPAKVQCPSGGCHHPGDALAILPQSGGDATTPGTGTTPGEVTPPIKPPAGAPLATLDYSAADFGDVIIGQTSPVRSVHLSNTGTADLLVSGVSMVTGQEVFGSTNTCGTPIAAGSSCEISLSFTPKASGIAHGTVAVTSNDRTVLLPVSGNGVQLPKVTLASTSIPDARVNFAYSYDLKSSLSVTDDSTYTGAGVVWSVVSGTLPAGLTLDSNGVISGMPTATGTGAVTVRATYQSVKGEQTYQLTAVSSIEDAVPNAMNDGYGDGNGDDILDSLQANVASFPVAVAVAGDPYITVTSYAGASMSDAGATEYSGSSLPRGVKLPLGAVRFTSSGTNPGGTVEFSVYVDKSLKANAWYTQDNSGTWKNIAKSVYTVGNKTKITFDVVDGGIFDRDGIANGTIVVSTGK